MPTSPMRAPRADAFAIAFQSFIDELAVAAGKDPIEFRLEMQAKPAFASPATGADGFDETRMRGVLELVRDRSGWSAGQLANGRTMGVAFQYSHRGYFAEVVDLSVDAGQKITIHKIWVAADVGRQIVNPTGAIQQVQGAVVEGLTHAMNWEITLDKGRVVQSTKSRCTSGPRTTRPRVSASRGFRLSSPAFGNAIFTATGNRVRSRPLAKLGYSWA